MSDRLCRSCNSLGMSVFYQLKNVPVNSMFLLGTRQEALDFPKGDIALGFCPACGFISNLEFSPDLPEYTVGYEASQGFSGTFSSFHRDLAMRLIERYDLRNKDIIEIGCGQGEFLTLLCELGGNRGIGFDPVYDTGRTANEARAGLTFIKDFYSEAYAHCRSDFVCCKMTLEHIPDVAEFVGMVRHSLVHSPGTTVFFQVPDTTRIMQECAFWDIYYEHCSYFGLGSLARLFRRCGFDILELTKAYDDQYLMISARAGSGDGNLLEGENDLDSLSRDVARFRENYGRKMRAWQEKLQQVYQRGQRAVLWGAGSKAVAFLTTLNIREEIEYVVDINPHKQGTYIAGTGQRIVPPEFLRQYKPELVLVMNPIYCTEIGHSLDALGVRAQLTSL